jgi:hypothetical protein
MYAAVSKEQFTDGCYSEKLARRINEQDGVREEDIHNVFDLILPEADPKGAELFAEAASVGVGQPHLCGSGPAFFFLRDACPELDYFDYVYKVKPAGSVIFGRTMSSQEALAVYASG